MNYAIHLHLIQCFLNMNDINSDLFYTPIQKEQAIQYIRDRLGALGLVRTYKK